MGIETPKAQNKARNQGAAGVREEGGVAGGAEGARGGEGSGDGRTAASGAPPGSLLPEGMPAKGVCSPRKETRDDLHT